MGTDGHVCSACGQPVATIVRRHKTLGAWVPTWVAGPCRNPKCETYLDESESESESEQEPGPAPEEPVSGKS